MSGSSSASPAPTYELPPEVKVLVDITKAFNDARDPLNAARFNGDTKSAKKNIKAAKQFLQRAVDGHPNSNFFTEPLNEATLISYGSSLQEYLR